MRLFRHWLWFWILAPSVPKGAISILNGQVPFFSCKESQYMQQHSMDLQYSHVCSTGRTA